MSAIALPTDLVIHSGSHKPGSGLHCLINCAALYAEACGFEKRRDDLLWDDHQSICRVVRNYAISVNDSPWSSDEARTAALKPVVCSVLGTERGPELAQRRLYVLANYAFRWASEATRHAELHEQSAALAAHVGKIVDEASARSAEAVARAARAAWTAEAAEAAGAAAWAAGADRDRYLREAADVLLEICLMA